MKRPLLLAIVMCALVSGGAAADDHCLFVKHKGTVGRRLIWTALIGVPIAPGANYDLVDSVNYPARKMSYKGKELEGIRSDGVRVVVVEKGMDLMALRSSCIHSDATPQPAPEAVASTTPAPEPVTNRMIVISGDPAAASAQAQQNDVAEAARRYREQKLAAKSQKK